MLAINHVSFATVAVLGLSIYYNQPFYLPLILFVIFGALLPDIDHDRSEISQLVPVINKFFGHRSFTHSVLGTLAFVAISYTIFKPSQWITYALLLTGGIGIYYLNKLMIRRTEQVSRYTFGFFSKKQLRLFAALTTFALALLAVTAALTVWQSFARDQIFILLVLGYISHIIGDFVTKEGVPLLWPWKKYFGLKIFRTGSGFETFLGLVFVVLNVYLTYLFWIQFKVGSWDYWSAYIDLDTLRYFDITTLLGNIKS